MVNKSLLFFFELYCSLLLVGENVPILGGYAGVNTKVMEELGYTALKKDNLGNSLNEIDWDKTRAVQIRSNSIYTYILT